MSTLRSLQLEVSLTDEHVVHGVQGNCSLCPAALAIKDALASLGFDVLGVGVTNVSSTVTLGKPAIESGRLLHLDARNPEELEAFIESYDKWGLVRNHQSFTFELTFTPFV